MMGKGARGEETDVFVVTAVAVVVVAVAVAVFVVAVARMTHQFLAFLGPQLVGRSSPFFFILLRPKQFNGS